MDGQIAVRNQGFLSALDQLRAGDGPGFLRAAAHAAVDPLVDGLIDSIRGGPAAAVPSAPPAGITALPAGSSAPVSLPAVAVSALQARIETLEAQNRAYEDTIARMNRAAEAAQAQREDAMRAVPQHRCRQAASVLPGATDGDMMMLTDVAAYLRVSPRTVTTMLSQGKLPRAAGHRGRANFWWKRDLVAWLSAGSAGGTHKPGRGEKGATPPEPSKAGAGASPSGDLIDVKTITQEFHISSSTIRTKCRLHTFPSPVAKRRLADLWRRTDIEQWARLTGQPQPSVETKIEHRDQDVAKALDAAIEHEDSLPSAGTGDLLTSADVRALLGLTSSSSLTNIKHRDKSFPTPAGKRGKAEVYRKSEINVWVAKRRQPQLSEGQIAAEDLVDVDGICRLLDCTQGTVWYWRKHKEFPAPATLQGQRQYWRRQEVMTWSKSHSRRRGPRGPQTEPPARSDEMEKTCENCGDRKTVGRFSICRSDSEQAPYRNKSIALSRTCDYHREPGNYRPIRPEDNGG